MYRIEYFDKKHKRIGVTWYSFLKRQSMGLDGIMWNGMARLKISGKAHAFRMYWPHQNVYEYCGTI